MGHKIIAMKLYTKAKYMRARREVGVEIIDLTKGLEELLNLTPTDIQQLELSIIEEVQNLHEMRESC